MCIFNLHECYWVFNSACRDCGQLSWRCIWGFLNILLWPENLTWLPEISYIIVSSREGRVQCTNSNLIRRPLDIAIVSGFSPRNHYITSVDGEAKLSTKKMENWRMLKVFTLHLNTLVTLNVQSVIYKSDNHIQQPNLLLKSSVNDIMCREPNWEFV